MEKFIPFPTDDKALVEEMNAIIGADFINQSQADYIKAFNQDIEILNDFINNPPSHRALLKKAALLEIEYNTMIEVSQKRWDKSKKDYDVGRNAIRNLASIKKEYDLALTRIRTYEAKANNVQKLLETGTESIWRLLESSARKADALDNKQRLKRLSVLRKDWTYQGMFSTFDSGDLIHYLDEIYDFKWFLSLMEKALKKAKNDDHTHYKMCVENQRVLQKIESRIIAAMGWRIQASSIKRDLYFDDDYWALVDGLYKILDPKLLQKVKIKQLPAADSYGLGPQRYLVLSRILLNAKHDVDKNKVFNSFWVKNPDLPMPLAKHGNEIVPKSLKHLIPFKKGFGPINWIRYYFFSVIPESTPFWAWIKKLLVGKPSHAVVIMNDAVWQMNKLKVWDNKLTLMQLIDHPGFKASLTIHTVLNHERLRIDRFKLPWFIRFLLKIPFLNNMTTQLIDGYHHELDSVQSKVEQGAKSIVGNLLDLLDKTLISQIQENVFSLPGGFIKQLKHFVDIYGTTEEKKRYTTLVSPVYLFKHFNFFIPNEANPYTRELNVDAVDSFLRYAENYWDKEDVIAANRLMDVITGLKIPKNIAQEKKLVLSLRNWIPGSHPQKEVLELLQWVASKIVARTGDLGNPLAYRFLKRFSPKSANIWKDKKEQDLDDKYTQVMRLFRKPNGQEIDLNNNTFSLSFSLMRKYIHDLTFEHGFRSKYLPGLLRGAKSYFQQYNGESDRYTILFYWIAKTNKDLRPLYEYLKKRFDYLFAQDKPMTHEYELGLMSIFNHDKTVLSILKKQIQENYHGKTTELLSLIRPLKHLPTSAAFMAKRFIYLVNEDDPKTIEKEHSLFEQVKEHPAFSEPVSGYLRQLMKGFIRNKKYKSLEQPHFQDWVERYGDQAIKEEYRLYRLNQLFKVQDKTIIDEYILHLQALLKTEELAKAFDMPLSQGRLAQLFDKYTKQMIKEVDWRGNWQYLMEHFDMPQTKYHIFLARKAWLLEFMFRTESFAQQSIMNRDTQDLTMHFKNIEIPNDQVSMRDFFGTEHDNVVKLCFKRLDEFTLSTDVTVIQTLERLFQDESIRELDDYSIYKRKLDVVKRAMRFSGFVRKGNFESARLYLDAVYDTYFALKTIEDRDKDAKFLIPYYEQSLEEMERWLLEAYRTNLFPVDALQKSQREGSACNSDIIQTFELHLLNDRSIGYFEKDFNTLFENKGLICEKLKTLLESLTPVGLDTLDLSLQNAELLSTGLSYQFKRKLRKRFKILTTSLNFDEALADAANSFLRILENDYMDESLRQADVEVLESYQKHQLDKNSLVRNLVNSLAQKLKDKETLAFDEILGLEDDFLKTFFQLSSDTALSRLATTLYQRIERLLSKEEQYATVQRHDWMALGRLLNLLRPLNALTSTQLRHLDALVESSLSSCGLALENIEETMEETKETHFHKRQTLNEYENEMIKKAMFVRAFGDFKQQSRLDKLLERIGQWQRLNMMSLSKDPLEEHRLYYSFTLINLTGNLKQRQRNTRLKKVMSTYYGAPVQANIIKVQKQALLEAIPEYVEKMNQHLYDYFMDKFRLNDHEQIQTLLESIQEIKKDLLKQGGLLQPEDIYKKYGAEKFQQVLMESMGKISFWRSLTNMPDIKHGTRLFAAVCISVRAEQLAMVWTKKLMNEKMTNHSHFSADTMAKPLIDLLEQLEEDYDLSSDTFTESIGKAIDYKSDFFVSWKTEYELNLKRHKNAA